MNALARWFDVHRHTVSRTLDRRNVARRPFKLLSTEQEAEAVRRHASGETQIEIAQSFGVDVRTVRHTERQGDPHRRVDEVLLHEADDAAFTATRILRVPRRVSPGSVVE